MDNQRILKPYKATTHTSGVIYRKVHKNVLKPIFTGISRAFKAKPKPHVKSALNKTRLFYEELPVHNWYIERLTKKRPEGRLRSRIKPVKLAYPSPFGRAKQLVTRRQQLTRNVSSYQ